MLEKMVRRKQRELDSIKGIRRENSNVPLETLANVSHGAIKVVKK